MGQHTVPGDAKTERAEWWDALLLELHRPEWEDLGSKAHFAATARDTRLHPHGDNDYSIRQSPSIYVARKLAYVAPYTMTDSITRYPECDIDRDFMFSSTPGSLPQIGDAYVNLRAHIHLPEVFADTLSGALAYVEAPVAEGRGTDARLVSPIQLEFQVQESTSGTRTVPWESGSKDPPKWLESMAFDLVAPWTHVPLGQLRDSCLAWQKHRTCRALAMLPFAYSAALDWERFRHVIRKADEELKLSELSDILMLLPEESIQMLPFAKWTKKKTEDKVVTAYWKLDEDRVLWAEGFHDRTSIQKHGRTIEDILGIEES